MCWSKASTGVESFFFSPSGLLLDFQTPSWNLIQLQHVQRPLAFVSNSLNAQCLKSCQFDHWSNIFTTLIYIYIYIYIFMHIYIHIYNYENKVPSWLSPQWLCALLELMHLGTCCTVTHYWYHWTKNLYPCLACSAIFMFNGTSNVYPYIMYQWACVATKAL